MNSQLLLGLLSFVLCFVFTPVCRTIAIRLGLVDKPDGVRKKHSRPIPRVGGLAIVLSYACSLAIMSFLRGPDHLYIQHYALLRVLLPPAILIFLVGLIDDLFTLTPFQKLAGQSVACLSASILGHVYAPESFSFAIDVWFGGYWMSVLVCAFWLVLCTNAINLIDGLDGLASGVGLIGSVATLLFGLYTHNVGVLMATIPLTGALLAFLYYNFNPASIFLGDCGSLTIGFMLGAISLTWERRTNIAFGMFTPICVLALPLVDVGMAIARRFLRDDPLFSADRGHIHHVIQDSGQKPKATALILYGACGIAIIFSFLARLAPHGFKIVLFVLFGLVITVGIRYLDYAEFRALRRVLSSRHMRQEVRGELYLRGLDAKIKSVKSVDDCWQLVESTCREMEFATVEMFFHNLYFDAVLQEDVDERDWWLTLPLGKRGYIRVSRATLVHVGGNVMTALEHLQHGLDIWERTAPLEDTPRPGLPKKRPIKNYV